MSQIWKLVGPDGEPYTSVVPGTLGGHRRNRIYGRLDCPTALRAIARGGYVTHRVFFLTEEHARAAGYRPCAVCLPMAYASWKARKSTYRVAGRNMQEDGGFLGEPFKSDLLNDNTLATHHHSEGAKAES